MGSGKSTTGKKLARRLSFRFVDLDPYIEEKEGKSIPEIFQKETESGFRAMEKQYLRSLNPTENTIVATGGGTPCFNDNIDFMNQTGLTIYLKMNAKQLLFRLTQKHQERPLLNNKNKEELKTYIKELLPKREEYYEKAKWSINGFNLHIPSLTKNITEYYQKSG